MVAPVRKLDYHKGFSCLSSSTVQCQERTLLFCARDNVKLFIKTLKPVNDLKMRPNYHGQVLNGYINPLWTTDRRARARAVYTTQQSVLPETSDYYVTRGGVYSDRPNFRRMTDLFYLDDMGRYQPVYREDRVFRTEPSTYFTSAAQKQEYVAPPPNTQSLTPTSQSES